MYALAGLKESKAPPIHLAEHSYRTWCVDIDKHVAETGEEVTADDLFDPQLWSRCGSKIQQGDLIRVRREGCYDFELVVKAICPGGLLMGIFGVEARPGTPFRARLEAAQRAATEIEENIAAGHMLTPVSGARS
jgi:hypothetical protein